VRRITSEALLVRSVPYGESDLIVQLLTATDGRISAIVRGGRKSQRRVGGALEPFHTIRVEADDKGREMATLKEARIARARTNIAASLDALDAAGTALRWARQLCPPRTPEPGAWATLTHLLDELDAGVAHPKVELAAAALRLLGDVGFGLELEQCVGCGKPRPEGRGAYLDPARGGVVCTACGGARRLLDAAVLDACAVLSRGSRFSSSSREARGAAGDAGEARNAEHFEGGAAPTRIVTRRPASVDAGLRAHADVLLAIVEEAMGAHAGIEA
jgi:DNA repair protein RecO (recombination protein O)